MDLSSYLEHTLLKPEVTSAHIKQLCEEAMQLNLAAVCIPPYFVSQAANLLMDTPVKTVTVVGFPMGYSTIPTKVEEAKRAFEDGADEIDMVVNISAVKDAKWAYVRNDIDSVTLAAHMKGKQIKVILETGLMLSDEIRRLCEICSELEVDYVKTSTGINAPGASIEIIEFLKEQLNGAVRIKASGGIRTRELVEKLVKAGAHRIGTSSSLQIISELK